MVTSERPDFSEKNEPSYVLVPGTPALPQQKNPVCTSGGASLARMSPLDAAKFFREKADAYLDITGSLAMSVKVGGCMSYSGKTKLEPNSSSG